MTDAPPRPTCAATSREWAEPLVATASRVRRWFLIEQPGAWGANAVFESGLGREVAAAVKARADESDTRLVLIRRGVARPSEPDGPRRWYAARSDLPTPALSAGTFTEERALLGVDVGAACGDASSTDPVFLVCTNGKHDPCCAEFGRPVYRELVAQRPDAAVFECSHIGGDRFAANIVCLPEGVYYGRVPVDDAAALADRYRQRRLDLDLYRGRSCYGVVEQRAEIAVRRALGVDGLDDVTITDRARVDHGDGEWTVGVQVRDRKDQLVRLRVRRATDLRILSCGHEAGPPRVIEVLDLTEA